MFSPDRKYFLKAILILFVIYMLFAWFHHVYTHFQDTNIDYTHWTGYLTGDEPAYLVYTRSIVEHRTLNIAETYQELHWPMAYWHGMGGVRLGVFPWHGIGLPVLLIFPYLVGGVFGTLVFMSAVTACVGAYIFKICNLVARKTSYAFATSLIFGVLILLPFSSQVYPDMVASLITLFVIEGVFLQYRERNLPLAGALIGFSLFLNPKFIVLFAVPVAYILYVSILRRRARTLVAFFIPFLSFLIAYLNYTWFYFGTVFFTKYTSAYSFDFDFRSNGVLGLLLDRDHGLIPYFPLIYLGFLGAISCTRLIEKRSLVGIGFMCLIYYAMNAFFQAWKLGVTTAGREILPIVVLWSIPFYTALLAFKNKAWFKVLLLTLTLVQGFFSISMTWIRYLGQRGGLYGMFEHLLGVNVGLIWPNFGEIFGPYDYLFLGIFGGCTLLIALLTCRASMSNLRRST